MKMTFDVPDDVAAQFKTAIPPGKRSSLIAQFMESEARKRRDRDIDASRKANQVHKKDRSLSAWESFDDSE